MVDVVYRTRPAPEVVRAATSFVGREHERHDAAALLDAGRLVTFTGTGGIGKTRLAHEVGVDVADRFGDGVWLVELGGLRAGDDVAEAVVATLGLAAAVGTPDALLQLIEELADAHLLLVLDNCEHVLAAVRPVVDALLRSTAHVVVLATSREPLGVGGERVVNLVPLAVPDPHDVGDVDAARRFPAVRLLEDRAVAASHGFTLDSRNLDDVVAIATRLDGLPLAIELAAVRLRSLSAHDLLERIGDRFAMLNRGNATALPRHRTLRAMVEWSLDLCSRSERQLWARMSVFAGSADLDAVLAVCDHDVSASVLLDDLDSLVAKSVVTVEAVDGVTRYRLLETVAELGREQLAATGESETVHRRHADHYRAVARRFPGRFWSTDQRAAVRQVTVERKNLLQAFESLHAGQVDDGRAALAMAGDLRSYWLALSQPREGRRWLDLALAATTETTPERVMALFAATWLSVVQNDAGAASRRYEQLAQGAAEVGEPALLCRVTMWTGAFGVFGGSAAEGVEALEQATAWFTRAGDAEGSVACLWQLTIGLALLGRHDDAHASGEQGVRLALESGEWGRSYMLWGRGHAAWAAGDHAGAVDACRRSLAVKYDYADHYGIALVLGVMSGAVLDSGDPVRAAALLGIAATALAMIGSSYASLGPGLGAVYQDVDDRTLTALGADAYGVAHGLGSTMTVPEARTFVLAEPPAPVPAPAPVGATADDVLSPREFEVATLVARGLSNRAIATELVVSHRTVEGHVERVLAKLGFRSRVEIAAWMVSGRDAAAGTDTDAGSATGA